MNRKMNFWPKWRFSWISIVTKWRKANVTDILPEGIRNVICCLKWLLWTPNAILHTLDDLLWCVEQLWKNHEKCHFFFYFPSKGIQRKKWHFPWFFKSFSTHHKRSSKICGSVWGPEKPFLAINHVSNAFRQNNGHIWFQLKFNKIAIWVKNSSLD